MRCAHHFKIRKRLDLVGTAYPTRLSRWLIADNTVKSKFLRFTEETNALDFLERAGEFITETSTRPNAWKWVVLSLHGALYGFAISACKGTDSQSVVKKNRRGHDRLITFDEALILCQDSNGSILLNLTNSQKNSVRRLKEELRNNFEHYIPGGWSIEMHCFPRISIDILDIIRFISIQTLCRLNLNQAQRKKIRSIVFQSKKKLKRSSFFT